MPALRVRVLGGFSVELDGRPLPDDVWRRNRARSLVKLLAIAPRARLHREQLMDALWPELDPAAASANLRKALHFARAALGSDSLTAHDQTIALDGEPLEVDAATFEAAARAGRVAEALELYRGDLLPDDRFEAWAEDYRERLRGRFHRVLRERAEALEREGDVAGAVEILERHTAENAGASAGGHSPGASGINWKNALQDPIRRDFIGPDGFAALMDRLGIDNDAEVILYGGTNNWFAAYAYWYFRYYGHQVVRLMDGGRKKWELEGRPMTTEPSAPAAGGG